MEIKENTQTNFIRFFGRNTKMKILDFLIENDRTTWNKGEIMSNANVGHTCLLVGLNNLLELGIIKEEKNKFTMNKSNRFAKLLYQIYNEINKITINNVLENATK
jgi:hypothetical protein